MRSILILVVLAFVGSVIAAVPGSQFFWSSMQSGLYQGTLRSQVVKPFFTPLGAARSIQLGIDTVNQFWVAKYVSQEQYVYPNASYIYVPTPTPVCYYRPDWGFANQVRGWSSATYTPIGIEDVLGPYNIYDGTCSDVGSCGFYLEAKVNTVTFGGGTYISGFGFSQTVVSPPTVNGTCIAIKGVVDFSFDALLVNYTANVPAGYYTLPAACQGNPLLLPNYCAAVEPLIPDCRATLEYA